MSLTKTLMVCLLLGTVLSLKQNQLNHKGPELLPNTPAPPPATVDGAPYNKYPGPFLLKCYNGNTVFKQQPCYEESVCLNNLKDFAKCQGQVTLTLQNQTNERKVAYSSGGASPNPNPNPTPNPNPNPTPNPYPNPNPNSNTVPVTVDGAPYNKYPGPFLLKCYNGNTVFKQQPCYEESVCLNNLRDFSHCKGQVTLTLQNQNNERKVAYSSGGASPTPTPNPNPNDNNNNNNGNGGSNPGILIDGKIYVYAGPFSLKCYDLKGNILRQSPACTAEAQCAALLEQYRGCPGRVTKLTPA